MPVYSYELQLHEFCINLQKIRSLGNTRPIGSESLIGLDEILWGVFFMKNVPTYEAACGRARDAMLLV